MLIISIIYRYYENHIMKPVEVKTKEEINDILQSVNTQIVKIDFEMTSDDFFHIADDISQAGWHFVKNHDGLYLIKD